MKFSYKFSNLLGTVYREGSIVFTKDGTTVMCPVGNKISCYDLRNNQSQTLPVEARHNFLSLAVSPNGLFLVAADEYGELFFINLQFRRLLYRKHFSQRIRCIRFSPDGKYFAFTKENEVLVYATPGTNRLIFDPFVLSQENRIAFGTTTSIDWSFDSRMLVVGSCDMMTRVFTFRKFKNITKEQTVGSHRGMVIAVFFEEKSLDVYSVDKDGCVKFFKCSMKPGELIPVQKKSKNSLNSTEEDTEKNSDRSEIGSSQNDEDMNVGSGSENAHMIDVRTQSDVEVDDEFPCGVQGVEQLEKEEGNGAIPFFYKFEFSVNIQEYLKENKKRVKVTAVSFNKRTHLMVTACSSGDFLLLDMTDRGQLIHSLNISSETITNVDINAAGDWIGLGVFSLGQLLIWEWQSETYVLKQQGHFNNMNVVAYSPDGQNLATGGEDGKVKMWSTQSGFCFVTFSDHTGPVTGLAFTQSGKAVLSSSLDGTVRACDLTRYRNFKTLTSPKQAQFSCISVDRSGELVAAGGQDSHDIYLWSLKTGHLLEVLSGHEGPVVSIQFSVEPGSTMMVSTGWDATVKVWDAIAATTARETVGILSDGLCVTLRPDGKQLAVATLNGQITMFNPLTGQQEGSISGRDDLGAGRADDDKITAKKNLVSKAFTTLCYSADGQFLLAGGNSKNVCIYNLQTLLLVKKFEISQNRSLDAMDDIISRSKMAENGINLALIEKRSDGSKMSLKLPGVQRGDRSLRAFHPQVRTLCLSFSPTGRSWAACTSEGLLIYSLDNELLFDPLDLDITITPSEVKCRLLEKDYTTALMMAIRLSIKTVIQEVVETIPFESVAVIVGNLPHFYVEGVLNFLAEILETTPHLGLYAHWSMQLITQHGQMLKSRSPQLASGLNRLQRSLSIHYTNLNKVCSHNIHTLKYLLTQADLRKKKSALQEPGGRDTECIFPGDEQLEEENRHELNVIFDEETEM